MTIKVMRMMMMMTMKTITALSFILINRVIFSESSISTVVLLIFHYFLPILMQVHVNLIVLCVVSELIV